MLLLRGSNIEACVEAAIDRNLRVSPYAERLPALQQNMPKFSGPVAGQVPDLGCRLLLVARHAQHADSLSDDICYNINLLYLSYNSWIP